MAWSQDVKIGIAQVALWKKAAKSSIHRMIRCREDVPVGRSGECPEEGDHLRCEDSEVAGRSGARCALDCPASSEVLVRRCLLRVGTGYTRRMIRRYRRRSCVGHRMIIRWLSVELVRGVCPPNFLRLHSSDDSMWVQRMRRS